MAFWKERHGAITLVIEAEMGLCQVCREPAGLVINPPCPMCKRSVSDYRNGHVEWRCKCGWRGQLDKPVIKRFCGIKCMQKAEG